MLVWIFAILLKTSSGNGWLARGRLGDGGWEYRLLPIVLLTFINMSLLARVMRGSMIETLSSNTSAPRARRACRADDRAAPCAEARADAGRVAVRHGLHHVDHGGRRHRIGVRAAAGQLVVNGAINRDYTLVLGLVVLTTVCAVLFNLLVDLAYAWLDPRIRY